MTRKKTMTEEEAEREVSIWLGDAKEIIENAVVAFTLQWQPWPEFAPGVEVMDKGQLRNAMGIRATDDYGDPWPAVEVKLMEQGFRWHNLGGQRVMYLMERTDTRPDDGWNDGEEIVDH